MAIDSYTKVLLHMNGSDASTTFTDESGKTWTAAGNAQIDTAQSKFGGASGNAIPVASLVDYISTPDHADFAIAAGNFTLDCWFRMSSITDVILCAQRGGAGNDAFTFNYDGATIRFNYTSDGTTFLGPATWAWVASANTWYHLALVRNGANVDFYVDGVKQGTTYNISTTSIYNSTAALLVFGDAINTQTASVWLDEFRFSVGIARWTTNFTPPTEEYAAQEQSTGGALSFAGAMLTQINVILAATLSFIGYLSRITKKIPLLRVRARDRNLQVEARDRTITVRKRDRNITVGKREN